MRPYRELHGVALREVTDDDGAFPCGCVILLAVCTIIVLAIFVQRAT
jgi:hypothetical protein